MIEPNLSLPEEYHVSEEQGSAATGANALISETSPYLLQHAHNPVQWHGWNDAAFARAHNEDKPILLSVGYSACHWCHVMERESFENPHIADLMNRDFVNIKVDREERPDVDAIYMSAVQMLTGQGGWPMTVFLTPDGKPFYGGTYYPPQDLYGRSGFPRVLEAVAHAWQHQRADILAQSDAILEQLDRGNDFTRELPDALLTPQVFDTAFDGLAAQFDRTYGGFGTAPKFPQPANLDFLLRYHVRSRREEPLAMVERTLQRMALGGMYDQLGGGFHRYSTDQTWLVPHFEKMLYDNAQLAQTYAHAHQATGKSFYRGVAEETLEYVLREMTAPEGGFYSAQDADSEGIEGKFFVWQPDEVKAILGERDGSVFCAFYDVTFGGNWEEGNILHVVMDAPQTAQVFGLSVQETAEILDSGRARLLAARDQRIKPSLDDKVLTAWNGLMLAAFAECGAIFNRPDFVAAAERNAEWVLATLATETVQTDGTTRLRLLRTYRNGQAKLNGYLEDYAFYADGLLHLYQATGTLRWLDAARALTATALHLFHDVENGGFFATSSDHETLIQRPKDWDDNATPSGNSVLVEVLLKLALLCSDSEYRTHAARVLRKLGSILEKHPYGFARMLGALDWYLASPKEIVVLGESDDPATGELLHTAYAPFLPNKIVVRAEATAPTSDLPHLAGRTLRDGKPTAYVCENYACQEPVTDAKSLARLLAQ